MSFASLTIEDNVVHLVPVSELQRVTALKLMVLYREASRSFVLHVLKHLAVVVSAAV